MPEIMPDNSNNINPGYLCRVAITKAMQCLIYRGGRACSRMLGLALLYRFPPFTNFAGK